MDRLNENQFRDFPFTQKPRPVAGLTLPTDWIVDFTALLPRDNKDKLGRNWFLYQVVRAGNLITIRFGVSTILTTSLPILEFQYSMTDPEFTEISIWKRFVGSFWLLPSSTSGFPVHPSVAADPRYPADIVPMSSNSSILTGVQATLTIGNPTAVRSLLPADGTITFTPSVLADTDPQCWRIEPCQVVDMQGTVFNEFIYTQRSDEDANMPADTYGSGSTYWPAGLNSTFRKLPNGIPQLAQASDTDIYRQAPSVFYQVGDEYRWANSTSIGTFPAQGHEELSKIFGELALFNCLAVSSSIDNSLTLHAGKNKVTEPEATRVADRQAVRVSDYVSRDIVERRLADGHVASVLPGVPCDNLIYELNGLTGPDIPVTVGPGLLLTSNGDGHLRISIDPTHPQIREILSL